MNFILYMVMGSLGYILFLVSKVGALCCGLIFVQLHVELLNESNYSSSFVKSLLKF